MQRTEPTVSLAEIIESSNSNQSMSGVDFIGADLMQAMDQSVEDLESLPSLIDTINLSEIGKCDLLCDGCHGLASVLF